MPGHGYKLQEGGFLLSVSHSVGQSALTWGMWTIVLTGMDGFVQAYPGYGFYFGIRGYLDEDIEGMRKWVGSGLLSHVDLNGVSSRMLQLIHHGLLLRLSQLCLCLQAVLKNVELRGSTLGSREEFRATVDFVNEHKIRPVVDRVVAGIDDLEGIDGLFKDLKKGRQFGKLIVKIETWDRGTQIGSKL
ncbi:MAG: hypothetical protein Q9166_003377 [cf. Caloplaca sp. 2 TL-2023]